MVAMKKRVVQSVHPSPEFTCNHMLLCADWGGAAVRPCDLALCTSEKRLISAHISEKGSTYVYAFGIIKLPTRN